MAEIPISIPARKIGGSVQPLNRVGRYRGEFRLPFGIFRQRWPQCVLFPGFSLSEGLRFAEEGWMGATVCVDTLESALMTRRSLRPLLLCYAKDRGRASAASP
jgi:hypothetical protein